MSTRKEEIDISLLLDTYMYLNYRDGKNGDSLEKILMQLSTNPEYGGGGRFYPEYHILEQALEAKPELGELCIGNQSHLMGCDSGTAACTFSTPDGETTYVAFRGTGDGEWSDNGIGMTKAVTIQQQRAVDYFDQVMENNHYAESQNIILTGHSKGGNKVQFITMESQYADRIDSCYAVDGQGFSEQAIQRWQETYGAKEYDNRIHKLYGLNGENDYVSVLGHTIIPKEQISYWKTEVETTNFAGYHDIKYFYASLNKQADGTYQTIWKGTPSGYVKNRDILGDYAATLSAGVMALPVEEREGAAAVIMQLMELGGERKTGINGEKLSYQDLTEFVQYGMPTILNSMLFTQSGRRLLGTYLGGTAKPAVFQIQPLQLGYQIETLQGIASQLGSSVDEVERIRILANETLTGCYLIKLNLKKETKDLSKEVEKVSHLADVLEQIVRLYLEAEQKVACL